MSDFIGYLPGCNSGSNQCNNHGNRQHQEKRTERKEWGKEASEEKQKAITNRTEQKTEDGRDLVSAGKVSTRNGFTGDVMLKRHQVTVAILLAFFMIFSSAVTPAQAMTDDGSNLYFPDDSLSQSVHVTEENMSENDHPFFRNTTLITRILSGSSTGWYISIFSDAGFLQHMWQTLNMVMTNGNDESLNDEMVQKTQETSGRTRRSSDSNQGDVVEPPPENTNPGDSEEEDPEDPVAHDPEDPGENVEDPGLIEPENGDGDGGNEDGNDDVAPGEPNTGDDLDDDDGTDEETVINDLTLELTIVGQGTVTSSVYASGETVTDSIIAGINEIEAGSDVTLKAFPADEHVFLYWRLPDDAEGDNITDLEYSIENIQQSMSIVAHFIQAPTYTVNIGSSTGGSVAFHSSHENEEQSLTINKDEQVTVVATPNDLYQFSHWSPSHDPDIELSTDMEYKIENIQENLDLMAHFKPVPTPEKYVLTIAVSNGGSAVLHNDHSSYSFAKDELVMLVAEPEELFSFSHWSPADDPETKLCTNSVYSFNMPEQDVSVKAHFKVIHPFEGGTGREGDPFLIGTAEQLIQLLGNSPQLDAGYADFDFQINLMEAHYQLVDDIDLNNVEWSPVGGSGANPAGSAAFTGVFDGNGKIISNLKIDQPDDSYQAMFHTIGVNGKINDLTILDPYVAAKSHGAVLAVNNLGVVKGVAVKTSHTPASPLNGATPIDESVIIKIGTKATNAYGNHGAGLIVFNRDGGKIRQSGVEAVVCADGPGQVSFFGLIAAENMGLIEECYAIGAIERPKSGDLRLQISHNGGLVGINRNGHPNYFNAVITNSYSIVKFMASSTIQGGIAGTLHRSVNVNNTDAIQNVYAVSDVTENSNTSFGSHTGSSNRVVVASYYELRNELEFTNTTGIGLSAEDLKLKDSFNNWDFSTIWEIDTSKTINNGYPYLKWQYAND